MINSVPYAQRQMDMQLKEFAEFCKVYLDDIAVASVSFEEHLLHLDLLFSTLNRLNINPNPAKSYIGYPSVQLLGLRVDALGMTTPEEKTKAITNIKFPTTLADVERCLGLTGSLRHYIHNYTTKAEPLEDRKFMPGFVLKYEHSCVFTNQLLKRPSAH